MRYVGRDASYGASAEPVPNELFEQAHQEDDYSVDDGLEQDRADQGALSKRRMIGSTFASSTAFPTTSAAIVATR